MYIGMYVAVSVSLSLTRAFHYKFLKCLLSYIGISNQCVARDISCSHLNNICRTVRRYTRLYAVVDCFIA